VTFQAASQGGPLIAQEHADATAGINAHSSSRNTSVLDFDFYALFLIQFRRAALYFAGHGGELRGVF